MVFNEVQTDLEAAGYEVWPYVLPAAAVNAPHRRDRVWFVAYRNLHGFNQRHSKHEEQSSQRGVDAFGHIIKGDGDGDAADTNGIRGGKDERFGYGESNVIDEIGEKRNATNTERKRYEWLHKTGDKNFINGESTKIRGSFTGHNKANNWDIFPTQSPICGRDDGVSGGLDGITFSKWRNESIKAYGNAVCPQVVHQIFKAIQEYETI
jgi:DNA (cytosine-5)-methyltransferase 1